MEFDTVEMQSSPDVLDCLAASLCVIRNVDRAQTYVQYSETDNEDDCVSIPIEEFESYITNLPDNVREYLGGIIPHLAEYEQAALKAAASLPDDDEVDTLQFTFIDDVVAGCKRGELTMADALELIRTTLFKD